MLFRDGLLEAFFHVMLRLHGQNEDKCSPLFNARRSNGSSSRVCGVNVYSGWLSVLIDGSEQLDECCTRLAEIMVLVSHTSGEPFVAVRYSGA